MSCPGGEQDGAQDAHDVNREREGERGSMFNDSLSFQMRPLSLSEMATHGSRLSNDENRNHLASLFIYAV